MKNEVRSSHGAPDGGAVEDGAFDKFMLEAGQIVFEAGTQVVQHTHLGPALKMFDDVAADEARAAGDEHGHLIDSTSLSIAVSCRSMDSTSLNWVRQRSRLWPSRWTLK